MGVRGQCSHAHPCASRSDTCSASPTRGSDDGLARLRLEPVRPAIQERDLADVVLVQHLHQQAGEPEAEAAVGRCAVAEEVEVVLDRAGLDALVLGLLQQLLVAVLALGARRQLDAPPEQVEAACVSV